MSVYNNKVYPTLPRAPEDTAQNYRLQNVGEIDKFFLKEMAESEKLAKKVRSICNSILITDTGLLNTTVITGLTSIAAFASGAAIPVGIVLTGASLLLSIATTDIWKNLSAVNVKQKKTQEDLIISSDKARKYSGYHREGFDR